MLVSTARVATELPALCLAQLCRHFADAGQRHSAQEFEVSFDDHQGFINFTPVVSGACRLGAQDDGVLMVEASGRDEAALGRIQRIISKHHQRFGAGDALTVEWSAPSERPAPD